MMAHLLGIVGAAPRTDNLWKYLTARMHGRTAVALERERNIATATAIRLLPAGAELLEYEREGRLRVIRMTQTAEPRIAVRATQHPYVGSKPC
jgi:hypothetical protein